MVLDYAAKVPQELSYPTYEEQEDDTLMQDLPQRPQDHQSLELQSLKRHLQLQHHERQVEL